MNDVFTETTDGMNISGNQLEINCITSKQNKFHLDSEGNLNVNSITTVVDNRVSIDFDSIYPIGSIYMNTALVDPSILFGGTWESLEDRFLLGASETYPVGSMAGKATVTLSKEEMPKHTHTQQPHSHFQNFNTWMNDTSKHDTQFAGGTKGFFAGAALQDYSTKEKTAINNETGGSQPHENMPPYLAVYMWKRIA